MLGWCPLPKLLLFLVLSLPICEMRGLYCDMKCFFRSEYLEFLCRVSQPGHYRPLGRENSLLQSCSVHRGMFNSSTGLYPLAPTPQAVMNKNDADIYECLKIVLFNY